MRLQKLRILLLSYKLFEGFGESFSYCENSTLKSILSNLWFQEDMQYTSLLNAPLAITKVYKFKK